MDGATELHWHQPTNSTSVKKVKFKFKDCGSGPGGEKKLKQRKGKLVSGKLKDPWNRRPPVQFLKHQAPITVDKNIYL